ncbi:MAG: response regulator transcription factor [Acidobacteria bacterium]|nr:response regulator transcription factor [Acidobacteriota bacterium]
MTVLVAQNDAALATFLRKGLEAENHSVHVVGERSLIMPAVLRVDCNLIILDLDMLVGSKADRSEHALLRDIRLTRESLSILTLSSRTTVEDRVGALDSGADDFVAKPFSYFEFSARIRALLRRQARPPAALLQVEDLEMNRMERRVLRDGRSIELTPKEFHLLEFLMQNSGRLVSRTMIMNRVWGSSGNAIGDAMGSDFNRISHDAPGLPGKIIADSSVDAMTNIVDVYINYLRKKIGDRKDRRLIHTIRGCGYQLGTVGAHFSPMLSNAPEIRAS